MRIILNAVLILAFAGNLAAQSQGFQHGSPCGKAARISLGAVGFAF